MKARKKADKKYDRRLRGYAARSDKAKTMSGAYHKPGSRNPRKQ